MNSNFNYREKNWDIKEGCSPDLEMLKYMHPAIVSMIMWANFWCYQNSVKPNWTSWMRTPEENDKLGATGSHIWRAADLSCAREDGWNASRRSQFEKQFRRKFERVGAYVVKPNGNLKRNPIVLHDSGHGMHFHLQCHKDAMVENI
jgi:hypothetical protein